MRLTLDPRRKGDTALGYEWLEPISYGYDQRGLLASVLCMGLMSDDTVSLTEIVEPDLSEDLMMNYNVSYPQAKQVEDEFFMERKED